MMEQQSITLTKCTIYNSNIHPQLIQLALHDNNRLLIYHQNYLPTISNNQILIKLALRLTYTPQDKQVQTAIQQIIFSFKCAAYDANEQSVVANEQSVIRLAVDCDKLKGGQNQFKTDLDSCVVTIVADKNRPLQLPAVRPANKDEQVESFIKQKEDYLLRLQKQLTSKRYRTDTSCQWQLDGNSMKNTPYFQKEAERSQTRINHSEKIKGLIVQARALRKQKFIVSKNQQKFDQFYSSTYPSLSHINMQDSQQEEQMHICQQSYHHNSIQSQHYHKHSHLICNNQLHQKQENGEYANQPRTNDSCSIHSSRSDQFLNNLAKNTSPSYFFDAKSPFKHRFL